MINIWETEDYNDFFYKLEENINKWKANNKYPKERNFPPAKGSAFYLWGPPGSGKTEYINVLINRSSHKLIPIKSLKNMWVENNIYVLDSTNEIPGFNEKNLQNILKNKNIFIIFVGWSRSRIFSGHSINPSSKIITENGWNEIGDNYWSDRFSIREKYLMTQIKNKDKIKKKEFHSLVWKAFENILTKDERIYFKNIVSINPTHVTNDNSNEFNSLLKKNIIQYNNERQHYVFSHNNIVSYLYFRGCTNKIKNLSFQNKDVKEISIIGAEPLQFINWWIALGRNGDIINFFRKFNLKMSVFEHSLIDEKITQKVNYSPLIFEDICILAKQKKYNWIYNEYLTENIDTSKELRNEDIGQDDISYFIYSILKPYNGDDYYPVIMNSMRVTNFQDKISWDNSKERYKMLNYILARYIQGYIDEKFSALKISLLDNILFSNWDINNKLTFYDFVKLHWDKIQFIFKDRSYQISERFDAVLNSGRGRSSILDASSSYKTYDKRFKTYRNSLGKDIFDIGHRMVNLSMYLHFEKHKNNISIEEMNTYYQKQYNGGPFHHGTQISIPFEKFMILLLDRYAYFFHNEPVYNKEFNYSLNVIPANYLKYFVKDKIKKFRNKIVHYLRKNNNLLNLVWTVDKIIGQNGFNYIWIRNYERFSIYDTKVNENSVFVAQETYTKDKILHTRKHGQNAEFSRNRKFNKYIIMYKLDDIKGTPKYKDAGFMVDLNNINLKFIKLKYIDLTHWNLSDENLIEDNIEKYENELLPIIKNGFKS